MSLYLEAAAAAPSDYEAQLECAVVLRERELHFCALYPAEPGPGEQTPEDDDAWWQPWPATPLGRDALRRIRAGGDPSADLPFDLFGAKRTVTERLAATIARTDAAAVGVALHSQFVFDLEGVIPDRAIAPETWFDPMNSVWDDLAHRARASREGDAYLRFCDSEVQRLRVARAALRAALAADNVPSRLRPLLPLARSFGLRDDGLRAAALAKTSTSARQVLAARVAEAATAIDAFTSEFSGGRDSPAVAAFFYLRLAAEEAPL